MKEKDMRTLLAKKLREFRTKAGLTAKEVGEVIGKSAKTVSGWEYGRGQPDADMLFILSNLYKIESIGAFYDDEPDNDCLNENEKELIEIFNKLNNNGKALILENARAFTYSPDLKKDWLNPPSKTVSLIVYNFPAAAGVPLYAEDDSYERMEFPADQVPKGTDFGVRISGDSMEPTIKAGSIVFVRKTSELRNGEIGIFMLDADAACKRFNQNERGVTLTTDNPSYRPIPVKDYQRFTITGKVLGYK
jgi:SOS-response transcriptional repressor LexA